LAFFAFNLVSHYVSFRAQSVEANKNVTQGERTAVKAAVKPALRVGIQVGHWKSHEVPAELDALYWNTGASAGGVDEVDVNLDIAQRVATLLEKQGVVVDVLPATIPEDYEADAFIAIHADGNEDTTVSGYKVAYSQWDSTGKAEKLSAYIESAYGNATTLREDSTLAISDDMTQYYAFNFIKYLHSLDESTPGAIVEVGYITNSHDRSLITNSAQKSAQGIADGIMAYLKAPKTTPTPTPKSSPN
jgi:N-acetylmuramoyl-L-alanine amidase